MLYLYALAADIGEVADLHGIAGEPLRAIPVWSAAAVAGNITETPGLSAATVKAQDTLVRLLHGRAAALLPMRFGSIARDEADLTRMIDARKDLFDVLARVRGCDQMTVRVIRTGAKVRGASVRVAGAGSGAGATALSGTEYLRARSRTRYVPELEAIAAAGQTIARDVRMDPAQQAGLIGSVYHLIPRGRDAAYRTAISAAAQQLADVHVHVTGPAPPYAFAS